MPTTKHTETASEHIRNALQIVAAISVTHAIYQPDVDAIRARLEKALDQLEPKPPTLPTDWLTEGDPEGSYEEGWL